MCEGGDAMAGESGGFPLRCCVALAAIVLNALTLNLFVVPSTGSYPSYAGFAAALASVVAYAVLLLVAARKPAALNHPVASWAGVASFAIGAFLVGLGYAVESTAASLVGWLLASLGTAWVVVLVGLMLARLEPSAGFAAVLAAFAAVYVVASVIVPLIEVGHSLRLSLLVFYALTFFVALVCAQGPGRAALLANVSLRAAPPSRAALTPRPRTSVLFAVLFALGLVGGYSAFAVFGTRESAGLSFVVVAVAVLGVAVASRFAKSRTDVVFHFGLLLVLAGLLVVPFVAQTASGERVALMHVSNTLLAAGSECFAMLVWIVLASRGAQRPDQALTILVGGRLAMAGGTFGGLLVGACASSLAVVNPLVPDVVAVAFAFALVAYALVGLRRFSFEEAVAGAGGTVAAEPAPVAPATDGRSEAAEGLASPGAAIERNCFALARRGGLTDRETEILKMLARGRSAPFIAQELVISPNTVKTHVKHIYAKLDAHSQQEIIDLVDGACAFE